MWKKYVILSPLNSFLNILFLVTSILIRAVIYIFKPYTTQFNPKWNHVNIYFLFFFSIIRKLQISILFVYVLLKRSNLKNSKTVWYVYGRRTSCCISKKTLLGHGVWFNRKRSKIRIVKKVAFKTCTNI